MNVKFPGGSDSSELCERRASSDTGAKLFSKHAVPPTFSLTTTSKSISSLSTSLWTVEEEPFSHSNGIVELESDSGDCTKLAIEFSLLSVV